MLKIKKQGSFYVGRFPDRMYVQFQVPTKISHKEPIIMIHVGAHTGACYESTPDGREGWKNYFLRKGFRVYIPDWLGNGRSGIHPDFCRLKGDKVVDLFVELLKKIKPICPAILITHSMSGAYGWKIAEKAPGFVSKIVALAPGAPRNIMQDSKERFSDIVKKSIIIEEKEVKKMWANARQFPHDYFENYFNSLDALSPSLANERVNYRNSQLKIDPQKLRAIKILVITGDSDPRHPKEADKSVVNFFREYHVNAEHYWLPDLGICGNGHLLMLEKNSDEIAELVYLWIKSS